MGEKEGFSFERIDGFYRPVSLGGHDHWSTEGGQEYDSSHIFVLKSQLSSFAAIVDRGGDGDFESIQSAVDSGAKNIFVRPGVYSEDVSIEYPNSPDNLKFEGEGAGCVLSGSVIVLGEPGSNVVFQNLKFSNNASLQLSVSNVLYYNCFFDSTSAYIGDDLVYTRFIACKFFDCPTGLDFFGGSKHHVINCFFDSCVYAVKLAKNTDYVLISGCKFNNCQYGVEFSNSGSGGNVYCVLNNCVFYWASYYTKVLDYSVRSLSSQNSKSIIKNVLAFDGEFDGVNISNSDRFIFESCVSLSWSNSNFVSAGATNLVSVNNITS